MHGWDDACNSKIICYNEKLNSIYEISSPKGSISTPPLFSVNDLILTVIDEVFEKDSLFLKMVNYNVKTGKKLSEKSIKNEAGEMWNPWFSENGKYVLVEHSKIRKGVLKYYVKILTNELNLVSDYQINRDINVNNLEYRVGNNGDLVFLNKVDYRTFELDVYDKNGFKKSLKYEGLELNKKEKFKGFYLKNKGDKYLLATIKYRKKPYPNEVRVVWFNPKEDKTDVYKSEEIVNSNQYNIANLKDSLWNNNAVPLPGDWSLFGDFEIFNCEFDSKDNLYVFLERSEISDSKDHARYVSKMEKKRIGSERKLKNGLAGSVKNHIGTLVISKFDSRGISKWNSIFFKSSTLSQSGNNLIHFSNGTSQLKSDYFVGENKISLLSVVPSNDFSVEPAFCGIVYHIDKKTGKSDDPIIIDNEPSYYNAALSEWLTPNKLVYFRSKKREAGPFSTYIPKISCLEFDKSSKKAR